MLIGSEILDRKGQTSWDFGGTSASSLVHGMHPYPARMHPLIARTLIGSFRHKNMRIADPFCGSGTVLVEALAQGIDSFGIDINPLACLISRAKTTVVEPGELDRVRRWTLKTVRGLSKRRPRSNKESLQSTKSLDYWFKPNILQDLISLRDLLYNSALWDSSSKWLLAACLSRTARTASNQRPFEFKTYRLPKSLLRSHFPIVEEIFTKFVLDALSRARQFYEQLPDKSKRSKVSVQIINADNRNLTRPGFVDLIITSPPYGDSDTTVGYEQFSRLSLSVFGDTIDRLKFDGERSQERRNLKTQPPCAIVKALISKVERANAVRAKVLSQYFQDLWGSLVSLNSLLTKNGTMAIVIGSRTVCGVRVPTPDIICNYAEDLSLNLTGRIPRRITRKVLPRCNHITKTINKEEILIFGRESFA